MVHMVFATDYLISVTFVVIGSNKNTKTCNFYYTHEKQLKIEWVCIAEFPKEHFLDA